MDIVYVVSSVGHFGSMSSERERESVCVCLVELLGLSIGDGQEIISRGVWGIFELGG